MKILLYVLVAVFVLIGVYFAALSMSSRKPPELGLLGGQLRACPASPNCVSSETPAGVSFVEPLPVNASVDEAWNKARQALVENGGEIVTEQDDYLHARFVTPLMRYVDDVELRLDADKRVIHIRSASRVGHSDLGANRARVAKIRAAYLTRAGLDG
ncbi:MAG: DUF1499 domain-containing protein [Gammaproteobacteria bacterium]|nr:DUF1499 domain-containing protein [Gammaproteobacteria bacterium]